MKALSLPALHSRPLSTGAKPLSAFLGDDGFPIVTAAPAGSQSPAVAEARKVCVNGGKGGPSYAPRHRRRGPPTTTLCCMCLRALVWHCGGGGWWCGGRCRACMDDPSAPPSPLCTPSRWLPPATRSTRCWSRARPCATSSRASVQPSCRSTAMRSGTRRSSCTPTRARAVAARGRLGECVGVCVCAGARARTMCEPACACAHVSCVCVCGGGGLAVRAQPAAGDGGSAGSSLHHSSGQPHRHGGRRSRARAHAV